MDFSKYFLSVILIILAFLNKSTKSADEDMENLIALLDKSYESLVNAKANRRFVLPTLYLIDNYQNLDPLVQSAPTFEWTNNLTIPNRVVIDKVATPDFSDILSFDKRKDFSVLVPQHAEIASQLIDIFLGEKDTKELLSLAVYIYDRINPYLFAYSLSSALRIRSDTHNSRIPNQIQTFPDKFFKAEVFTKAREEEHSQPYQRESIEMPRAHTANDLDIESRLDYWREDIALNLHHWHWHTVYPSVGDKHKVDKDRRGELFYYMHHQILARYDFERLSNHLERTEKFPPWYSPIKEGYIPKLDSLVTKKTYASRAKNMILTDTRIPTKNITVTINKMIRWKDRILRTIDLGYAKGKNGKLVELDIVNGINILGNMMEPTVLSPDRTYYGNFHNGGHIMIAFVNDPTDSYKLPFGVMGESATAMRDPVFYRWHTITEDIFHYYKAKLPPYTGEEIDYPGIIVSGVSVKTEGEEFENVFRTFWTQIDVNLINGLDYIVRYTHLDHQNFIYEISIENGYDKIKEGTCRIFLSPAVNDATGEPWKKFTDQKNMFIEMDKFKVELLPGSNKIIRRSSDSAVTIPFEDTFYDFDRKWKADQEHIFTGCGWPHHLLLPKGTTDGFASHLFVMISNYDDDKVENSKNGPSECYCGVKNGKYPDKRPMGYPFDRLPRLGIHSLQQFLTPNMFVQQCVIVHSNEIYQTQFRRTKMLTNV